MLNNFNRFFKTNKILKNTGDLYRDFLNCYGGDVLGEGLFTVFKIEDISKWNGIVSEAYMDFPKSFSVFGYDWLGRCFAIDLRDETKGNVLMFEIGTADILEIPVALEEFLNDEIPNFSNDCLAGDSFEEWKEHSNVTIKYGRCTAYKVPLFLNGIDDFDNLEDSDLEVYWGIVGQLIPRR